MSSPQIGIVTGAPSASLAKDRSRSLFASSRSMSLQLFSADTFFPATPRVRFIGECGAEGSVFRSVASYASAALSLRLFEAILAFASAFFRGSAQRSNHAMERMTYSLPFVRPLGLPNPCHSRPRGSIDSLTLRADRCTFHF